MGDSPHSLRVGAEEDAEMHAIFQGQGWPLHHAATIEEAVGIVRQNGFRLVISDRRLADGGWQNLLERLSGLPVPPRLIVTDPLADHRLWVEVLSFGAYDLLVRPLEPEEVTRVVQQAWASRHNGRV